MKYRTGAYEDELDNRPEHHLHTGSDLCQIHTGPGEQGRLALGASLVGRLSPEVRQPRITLDLRLDWHGWADVAVGKQDEVQRRLAQLLSCGRPFRLRSLAEWLFRHYLLGGEAGAPVAVVWLPAEDGRRRRPPAGPALSS